MRCWSTFELERLARHVEICGFVKRSLANKCKDSKLFLQRIIQRSAKSIVGNTLKKLIEACMIVRYGRRRMVCYTSSDA